MKSDEQILEQVIDVLEGRVTGEDAAAVLQLVADDQQYAEMHRFATELLAQAHESRVVEVPASTRSMLESLLPARASLADTARIAARSFARLVRSSAPGVAFAGARSATATHRQLVFDTNGLDLVVELHVHGDRVEIAGQVLGATEACSVELVGDEHTATTVTDEFGDFVLTTPRTSALQLVLHDPDGNDTVADLTPFLDPEPHGASA